MRRLLILIVLAVAGTLLWMQLRSRPSGPGGLRLVGHENVLAALADGELVRTTVALDAGTPRGQAQTVEVDRRGGARAVGCLSRPDGEPPYAWLVGEHPGFTLDVLQPQDRELLVELANGTEGAQSVDVYFNGGSVARADLPAPGEVLSLVAAVPAALQRRGANQVELQFTATQMRQLEGELRPLPLAALLGHVAFTAPGRTGAPPPAPPRAGLVEEERGGERRQALILPPETAARAPLRLPRAPRVALRFSLRELRAPLEVALQLDDVRVPLRVFQPGMPLPSVAEFDLTPWAGRAAVLEFWAREAPAGGEVAVRLSDANILVPADWIAPERAASSVPAPVERRLSFLIVVLDAFARRFQGTVRNGNMVTPAFDALADNAIVFEDATAPASYTLASIGSLLTGQLPVTHGVLATELAPGVISRLAPDAPRLARELRARGWRTAAWITNPNAAAAHGYGEGFERYEELFADEQLWRPEGGVPGDKLPAQLAAFLAEVEGQPFLAYVHVFEPHAPYDAPPDLRERFVRDSRTDVNGSRAWIDACKAGEVTTDEAGWSHLRDLYAARAALSDRVLGRLFKAVVKAQRDMDTVVVVLSDHGESLGERGLIEHGDAVPHEQIDIPLMLAAPGLGKGRRRGPAGIADVAPTLLRLAGLQPPPAMQGTDLLAGALDPARPLPAISSVYLPEMSWSRDGLRLVVDLLTRRVRLYDDTVDPREEHDLSAERPATRLLMLRELCRDVCAAETARAAAGPASGAPLDAVQIEKLKAIGYAGGTARTPGAPLRLTSELRRLLTRL